MKLTLAVSLTLTLAAAAQVKEPAKKPHSTVPAPYPSIIQLAPGGEPGQAAPQGIIQNELGGREMQFFESATKAGRDQLALTELAKSKGNSEQIKAVAETLASTQTTESKEVARLAAAKKVSLNQAASGAGGELAKLTGDKFEKAWIEQLMAVNESGVAAYEAGAKSADADVRSFAEKMLPVAKARLQMAQRLGGRSPEVKAAATPQRTPAPPSAGGGAAQPIPPPVATPAPAKQ